MNRFQSWYRMQPAALRALLTINVVVYVLWRLVALARLQPVEAFVGQYLALHADWQVLLLHPWQLVTYNFLHLGDGLNGLLHILFNMLWLVWIGREYEELHGPHRLLSLYVLAGVGGGLMTVLLHALMPGVGAFGGVVYGASASVLGVLAAVGTLYPFKSVAMLFIGTVRLIYVVIGFLVIDLLLLSSSGTSVSAHLGGALFGFLIGRGESRGIDLSGWARLFFLERRRPRASAGRRGSEEGLMSRVEWFGTRAAEKKEDRGRRATIHPMRKTTGPTPTEKSTLDSEVDRILDKISEKGYEALTDDEKSILHEASKR